LYFTYWHRAVNRWILQQQPKWSCPWRPSGILSGLLAPVWRRGYAGRRDWQPGWRQMRSLRLSPVVPNLITYNQSKVVLKYDQWEYDNIIL
jgi:hypothetical protein